MNKFKTLLGCVAIAGFFSSIAYAATSSVNPTVPAQNSPLSSAAIRNGISLPAYNDITYLLNNTTTGGGLTPIANNTLLGNVSGSIAVPVGLTSSQILTLIGLTSAATPQYSGLSLTGVENINLNTGSLIPALTGTTLHQANINGALNRSQLDAFANSAHFSAVRADGTAAAPTALQSGDVIGSFNGWGYDGTSYGAGSSYQIATAQIWTPSAHGTNASIWTTPNGTTTPVQQLIIGNDGGVTVGAPAGGSQGVGSINAQSLFIGGVAVSASSGSISLGSITTTNPHISADVTSGFYTAGAGLVDLGIAGVKVAEWASTGATFAGTTTANNLTVTGTCTGCGTPAYTNHNTFLGTGALSQVTTGTDNSALGFNALHAVITDGGNTAFGSGALQNYAVGNTTSASGGSVAIGFNALGAATTSQNNTAVGFNAGAAVTSGGTASQFTFMGTNAGKNITGNSTNIICIGVNCGTNGASGLTINSAKLVCIGDNACASVVTDSQGVAIGYNAQIGGTGVQDNVAIGYNSGANATNNTSVGSQSGGGTGGSNTLIGIGAGKALTSGATNTFLGALTGFSTGTTGSRNVLIGASLNLPAAGTSDYMSIGNGGALKATITGPTISSGFGTSPSIVAGGTSSLAFQVNVGTGGSATTGVVSFANAMPIGYLCNVTDQSTTSSTVFVTKSTITSTSTVTFTNYNTSGTAAAWVASDVLNVNCNGL